MCAALFFVLGKEEKKKKEQSVRGPQLPAVERVGKGKEEMRKEAKRRRSARWCSVGKDTGPQGDMVVPR